MYQPNCPDITILVSHWTVDGNGHGVSHEVTHRVGLRVSHWVTGLVMNDELVIIMRTQHIHSMMMIRAQHKLLGGGGGDLYEGLPPKVKKIRIVIISTIIITDERTKYVV